MQAVPVKSPIQLPVCQRSEGAPRSTKSARAGKPRKKIIWAQVAILLTVVSCIKFFRQANFGLSGGDFEYTQGVIETSALGLGLFAAVVAFWTRGPGGRLGKEDLLFGCFVLISVSWSWRSFNPRLSVVHALCFFIAFFNVRVTLYIAGVRETFTTLYWATCSMLIAAGLSSLVAPEVYPLFSAAGYDGVRARLSIFQMHPIEIADIMVLNLIVGTFLKIRYRLAGQLLCGAALLSTASRASEVCGVAILLLTGFQATRDSRKWRSLLRLSMAFAGVALLVWLAIDLTSLLRTLFPTSDTSLLVAQFTTDQGLNGRLPLWTKVIGAVSVDNFMGYGFQGYRLWIFALSGWAGHAHNSILDSILTGGYVGSLCLIAYVLYGLFRSRKGLQPVPPGMCRSIILYSLIVGMMGPTLLQRYEILYIVSAVFALSARIHPRNRYRCVNLGSPLAVGR